MAVESIGALYPTKIPGLADAADIQAALRAYHYGSYTYSTANTSPGSLEANSMAKFLYDIETDIAALEARPSSGGNAQTTEPVPADFSPADVPDGYIWVDSDGTLGGVPTGATAVFTNSAPTTSLTTGTIWVDKDATAALVNPFIPQAIIAAKGDLIAGTANDTVAVLSVGTNGYVLAASSATASGLLWTDSATSTQTLSNKSISLGSNTITSTLAQLNTAVSDADVASLAGTETLTNKTLTSPAVTGGTLADTIIKGLEEDVNVVASAATGTINFDVSTASVWYYTSNATANFTLNFRYSSSVSLNTALATGDAITLVFLNTNGSTAYYPSAFQIDGNSVTPKVPAAISAGNASAIDAYSFTIIKTASATFTVLETQTKFA